MSAGRRVVVRRRPPALGRSSGLSGPRERLPDVPAIVGLQLRRALRTVAAVAGLLLGLPVLAAWVPEPWAWVALSVAVHGAWVCLAVLQLRCAERLER
ncbi:hypothetical protein [Nonomuraea candida]|uniref:hypothetical protein n=1 Tax=Nonomuraea candida TaxID=359159 RepID=UPI0005BDA0F5|nr:hypothetical protein [Nonomuraea candida]